MTGTLERHGHWFCGERCAQDYAAGRGAAWWRSPVVWSFVLVGAVLLAGAVWPAAAATAVALRHSLRQAGGAVLLGLLLGGAVDHYIPKEYITRWLAGTRRRTIVTAMGLGFLASSCSHGCLALSMELFRKGASVPAVITFLLASPWASLSLTFLLVSLMGGAGLFIVVAALLVAMTTGLVFQGLDRRGWLDPNPHAIVVDREFSVWQDLRRR